jgi:hypothetical protein
VAKSSNSGSNKIALGVGLGVGITLGIIVVGVGLWFCLRRKRVSQTTEEYRPSVQEPVVPHQEVKPVMGVGGAAQISRKAVPTQRDQSKSPVSQTTELTGEGVRRELSGRDARPVTSPSSPVSLPGEHEVSGEGLSRELPGQSRSPPPVYSHAAVPQPELEGQGHVQAPRWELQ